jgi:hypothetical protein
LVFIWCFLIVFFVALQPSAGAPYKKPSAETLTQRAARKVVNDN